MKAALVATAAALAVVLVGWAIWAFGVASAPIRGAGDAYRDKHQAERWTAAQADFHRRYEGILALDRNITVAAGELKVDPKSQIKRINLVGLKQACNEAIGAYNTKAKAYNSRDFRDAELPSEIDITNPQTDCKE